MAAITITRGLPSVFSVYNIITIEFTIDTGVVPSVRIANNGTTYTFTPVRIALNQSGLDTYIFDASEAVKSFMGLPPMIDSSIITELTKSITISILATGATTVSTTGFCSYGYLSVGEIYFDTRLENGTLDKIYRYSDNIYFYKKSTTEGVLTVKVGDVVSTYGTSASIWNQGVIRLALNSTQRNISGTVIIDLGGTYEQSFEQIKLPTKSGYSAGIAWLNRSGLWAEVYMRELSRTRINKQSNTIPINYTSHNEVVALNREISADKKVSVTLDCIAYNEEHYRQLTEIQDSLVVLFESKKVRVANISNKLAACKQNLYFSITLEYEDYVPTY